MARKKKIQEVKEVKPEGKRAAHAEQQVLDLFETLIDYTDKTDPEIDAEFYDRLKFYMPSGYTDPETGELYKTPDHVRERAEAAVEKLKEFFRSQEYSLLREKFTGTRQWFVSRAHNTFAEDVITLTNFVATLKDLTPDIIENIDTYKKNKGLDEISFSDFVRTHDPKTGKEIPSMLWDFLSQVNKAKSAETAAILEQIKAIRPSRYVIPIHPISKVLTQKNTLNTKDPITLPVKDKGTSSEVKDYYIIKSKIMTEDGRPLEPYQRTLVNKAFSLLLAGNEYFTAGSLYRAFNKNSPTPKREKEINKAIDTARRTLVTLNFQEEKGIKTFRDRDGNEITVDLDEETGPILNVIERKIRFNGKIVTAWRFASIEDQVILAHSIRTGMIVSLPGELMDVKEIDPETKKIKIVTDKRTRKPLEGEKKEPLEKSLTSTEYTDILKEYLAWRIGVMQNDLKNKKRKVSHVIKFSSVYNQCDIDKGNRTETGRIRDIVFKILDYWKLKKHIRTYTTKTVGQKIASITIFLYSIDEKELIQEQENQ